MQLKRVVITTSIICVMALLINDITMADPVTGLNSFTPGQAATAASVNQNFTEVQNSVNDNDARVTTNTGNIGTNTTNIGTNTTAIGTNTTNIGNNFSLITGNTSNITNNFDALDQRLIPLEAGLSGQDVTVDCSVATGSADALLNTTLIPGNTYVIDGFCDGPIYIQEPAGRYRFRGVSGNKTLDGIVSPVGQTEHFVVGVFGPISARFDDMTVSGANYTSQTDGVYVGTFFIEGRASVGLHNVDVIGGDAGVFSDAAYVFLGSNVNVTGFGQSGLAAGRTGLIFNGGSSLTVTGALGLDGGVDGYREALATFKNGMIDIRGANGTFSGGTDDGSNVNFESIAAVSVDGGSIRVADNGTINMTGIIGAYRNGTIRIDTGTVTGLVEVGESSVVRLQNVIHSGGNIDVFRNSVLHTDNTVLSNGSDDLIDIGTFSTFRMNGGSIGNLSVSGIINLYRYGVLETRNGGTPSVPIPADLNGRNVNCEFNDEGRFSSGTVNIDNIDIGTGGDCP